MISSVIDIGTNTVILLIAKVNKSSIRVLHDEAHITRLGQGLSENHFFHAAAMQRTLEVLKKFKKTCDEFDVEKIEVVGTAAFRVAANAQVMLEKVKDECGFKVKIITGEEEAEAVFHAAYHDFQKEHKKLLVIDIGGGSTEIIIGPGPKNGPQALVSLPMGSVRLTEEYIRHDPIAPEEFKSLLNFLKNELQDQLDDFMPAGVSTEEYTLVATAGTATTVAATALKMSEYDPEKIHGHVLMKEELGELIDQFINSDINTRKKMPGMTPERADVIVAGSILLHAILTYFKKDRVLISDRGLRYGVFYKKFLK